MTEQVITRVFIGQIRFILLYDWLFTLRVDPIGGDERMAVVMRANFIRNKIIIHQGFIKTKCCKLVTKREHTLQPEISIFSVSPSLQQILNVAYLYQLSSSKS